MRRIALLAALALSLTTHAIAQPTIFVVRHAERADAGTAAATMADADPDLSDAGHARARSLAAMLKDAGVKAIFATNRKRTQQTAAPLATALGLTVVTIPSGDTAELVAKVKAASGNVLVVGHSNTVPSIVAHYGATVRGPDGAPVANLPDDDYGALFVLTLPPEGPGPAASMLALRYGD